MRLVSGIPFLDNVSVLILNYKVCARKFFAVCKISLADLQLCDIVLHPDCLVCRKLGIDCKLDAFRCDIPVCRFCLDKGVLLSVNDSGNRMRLLCGNPLVNSVSVPVFDPEVRACNFLLSRKVGLGDKHLSVFHDKVLVSAFGRDRELNGLRVPGEPFRGRLLCQDVRLPLFKAADCMRLVGRNPLVDKFAVLIRNSDLRARDFLLTRDVNLIQEYLPVFHHDCLDLPVILDGKLNAFRPYEPFRCRLLCQDVCLSDFEAGYLVRCFA